MPLTADEQSRYSQLVSKYGMPADPAPPDEGSLWARAGEQTANLPSSIAQGLAGSAVGLRNLLAGDNSVQPWQIPKPFDIAPPTTFGQKAVDFGANLASNVGQFLIPGGAVSRVGRLAGLGAAGSAIAGDVAAGAFSGLQNSPTDAALGAGEFGALGAARFLPWYARLGVNAAVPVAGQLARGIDPTSGEALAGTAAQMAFGQIGKRANWNEASALPTVGAPPGNEIVPWAGEGTGFTMGPETSQMVNRSIFRNRARLPESYVEGEFQEVAPEGTPQLPAPRSIINPVEFSPDRRFTTSDYEPPTVASPEPSPRPLLGLPEPQSQASRSMFPGEASPQHPTQTPQFKEWFGNSKITDKSGNPEIIYRGESSGSEHDVFDPRQTRERGFFFTPDKSIASIYAQGGEPRAFYIKAEKLLDLTRDTPEARKWITEWAKAWDDEGWIDRGSGEQIHPVDAVQDGRLFDYEGDWSSERWKDIQASAKADGYDAVKLPDWDNNTGTFPSLVVFDPTHIKSATGNSGAFSKSNPSINGSVLNQALIHAGGGAAGGLIGYAQGNDDQDRLLRAGAGFAIGAGAPYLLRKGMQAGKALDRAQGFGASAEDAAVGGRSMLRKDTAPAISEAYDSLAQKTGFPAVSIGHLAAESGLPLEAVKAHVLAESNAGRAVLSQGDFSLSDKATQEGAVSLNGDRMLQVRILPQEGMTSRGAEAGAIPLGMFSKTKLDEAAMRNERGSKSIFDKGARQAEVYLGRGLSDEAKLALEKGKGFGKLQADKAQAAAHLLSQADPVEMDAARTYWESPRDAAAKTILRTTVSPDTASAVEQLEKVKANIQQANFEANAGSPAKQEVFKDTPLNPQGNWQGRFYQAFVNPKKWDTNVGPKRDALITELAQDPDWAGYDHQQISAALDEYGASIRNGESVPQGASAATHKLDRRLTMHRKDLSGAQWDFLNTLRGDPKLTADEKMGLNDIYGSERFNDSDQAFLRQLAGDTKRFSESDRIILNDIASEKVLSKATREYLGEITDPRDREILSAQKLIHGAASAKVIANLRDSEVDGRKLIYTTEEHTAAKMTAQAAGDTEKLGALENYIRAPDRPGLGSIAGNWVDRQVLDALNAQQRVTSPWMGNLSALNRVMKNVLTAWNPGTHARNIMQVPLQAMIARVAPWELAAGVRAIRDPAMADELAEQGIRGANYAKNELDAGAKDLNEVFNPTKGQKLTAIPSKIWKGVQDFYGLPDDVTRVAAYVKRKKAMIASGMSEPEARDAATQFVNRYTMNYGAVSPAVKTLRNLPFVSPFISYNAEMLRILKNLGEDAISGKGEDRVWAAASLAQLLALPLLAAKMGDASLSGKDRDDWEKLKALEPSFLKHQLKVPLGREKDGSFRYFSFGPITPAGDFAAMMRDLSRGDIKTLVGENPFVGIDKTPAFNQIAAQISGEDPVTHAPVKTPEQRVTRLLQSVTPSLTPGIGNEWQRDARAFTPNTEGGRGLLDPKSGRRDTPSDALRGLIGLRTSSENPQSLFASQKAAMSDELSQAGRDAKRLLRSNAAPVIKAAAQKKLLERQQEIRAKYAPLLGGKP